MDRLSLINAIRRDARWIEADKIPVDVFPEKIQNILFNLVNYENFNLEYCMSILLSVAGAAIGNSHHVHIKGSWNSSPALFMMLVGRPGLGKTPPLSFLYKPLRERDEEHYHEYCRQMKQHELMLSQLGRSEPSPGAEKPELVKNLISDFTVEAMFNAHKNNPRGIAVVVDEILGLFKSVYRYSNGSNLIEVLLSAYSGQTIDYIRKSEKYPILIRQPCISLIGGVQTNLMDSIMCKEYESNGLLDRFLFVYPKDVKISEWDEELHKGQAPDTAAMWKEIVDALYYLPCDYDEDKNTIAPRLLHMSPEAKICFYGWYNGIVREVNSIQNDMEIESRKMKLSSNAAKIALILQALKWASGEGNFDKIDLQSVQGAIKLISYYEDSFKRIPHYTSKNSCSDMEFLERLSESFTTAQAEAVAQNLGISRRSTYRMLDRLSSGPSAVLAKLERGIYIKLTDNTPGTLALGTKDFGTMALSKQVDNQINNIVSAKVPLVPHISEGG